MDNIKAMNIRIPVEMHEFLRSFAFNTRIPMNTLIIECIKKFMKNHEKKVDSQ